MFEETIDEFAHAASDDVGILLGRAYSAATSAALARLNEAGHPAVRIAHLAVFMAIAADGSHISAMAKASGMTRQAMSALVRDVEAAGYVESIPDPADGRAVLVRLTDRGAAFCRQAVEIGREFSQSLERALGADEVDRLRSALRVIAAQ